jgi:hypothetical protein
MINSSISECNNKCDTRIAEQDIGTNRSNKTKQNSPVHGYGFKFGPPRAAGSGCWTGQEPNGSDFVVQTQTVGGLPAPVAHTIQSSWGFQ